MKTLYKGSHYRCIHSPEEEAACLAEGWSADGKPGWLYIVHTAIPGGIGSVTASIVRAPVPEVGPVTLNIPQMSQAEALVMVNVAAPPLIITPAVKRPSPIKFRPPVLAPTAPRE